MDEDSEKTRLAGNLLVLKDRYEVERELGRGGMSVVYLARDRQLMNKRVVVKVLLDESQQDAWIRKKFLQEMEALARIDHPGVVGALDTGETAEGRQFLVMQYIEGQNLRQALEKGPLEFGRAASILRQVGQALSAAHDKGVWHRDFTPENIMLQKHGASEEHAKIIDFGIAGIQDSAFGGEKTQVAGKYSYMSPEQFAGKPSATTDVYAMGICAYEMVTGQKPFAGTLEHLVSAEKAKPEPPQSLRSGLPEEAGRAILKAISYLEANRYQTAHEFGEAISQALVTKQMGKGKSKDPSNLEVGHILFTDLVGYSLLPMDQQREYLSELQNIVKSSAAFKNAEENDDVISLPTGDGMALSFFGDPTQPAQCAFEISKALLTRPQLKLRMGIHSGPVYKVADINANSNVAGGGINMAQRVMDSGDAGHILVSETMAETLNQLSSWRPYLVDFGERTVKHGVILHIYNLATAELGRTALPQKFVVEMKEKRSASNRKPIAALAAVALLGALGFAVWKFMVPIATHELQYFFTVQRSRNEQDFGQAFRSAGNVIFETDYKVALNVTSPQQGYLYVLNEAMDAEKGKKTIVILSPQAGAEWDSKIGQGQTVRIPKESWFQMDQATGTEICYVVWSVVPVQEIEKHKAASNVRAGFINIEDGALISELREFLRKNSGTLVEKNNEQTNQTELKGTGDIMVQKIPLRHQ